MCWSAHVCKPLSRKFFLVIGVWCAACGISLAADSSIIAIVDSIQFRMDSPSESEKIHVAADAALRFARQRLLKDPHGHAWIHYLQLDKIDESMKSLAKLVPYSIDDQDNPSSHISESEIHLELIAKSITRFYGIAPGLEMAELVRLRQRLAEFVPMYRLRLASQKVNTELERRKKAVRTILQLNTSEHLRFLYLEPHLRWFQRHRQAQEFLASIASQSQPNVILHLNSRNLTAWSQQTILRTIPFQERIENRHVQGTASLSGTVKLLPLESPAHFSGCLQLDAHIDVWLSGRQGPLMFHLQSSADATGHQVLSLVDGKIYQRPLQVCAAAELDSASICTPRNGPIPRLLRSVGLQVIDNQQRDIEVAIGKTIANKLSEELQEEVSLQLSDFDNRVIGELRLNSQRLGMPIGEVSSSSSASSACLKAIVGKSVSLGAPNRPPSKENSGLAHLQVHQSLLNSLFYRTLAGREVTDLRKTLASFGILLNAQEGTHDAGQGIMGITFAEDSPMSVNVTRTPDGECLLELRVSGTSYRFDQYRLSAMDFVARFQLRNDGLQVSIIRQGPVEVLPPPGGSSLRFVQQRQIISARLQELFPVIQQFPFSRLLDNLMGDSFTLAADVEAEDGWFNLHLR